MKYFPINLKSYLYYKFFNSFFTGLSVGSVFTIYAPLKPSVYSVGGIILALGMLIVAKFYQKLITIRRFFYISLFVEAVILVLVLYFLIKPYTYSTALLVYSGYQLTFIFGAYLVRAETLILRRKSFLSFVDISKQSGYLAGLVVSFLFYRILENFFSITGNQEKVYLLHYLLLLNEILIIYFLLKAFNLKTKRR